MRGDWKGHPAVKLTPSYLRGRRKLLLTSADNFALVNNLFHIYGLSLRLLSLSLCEKSAVTFTAARNAELAIVFI